MKNNEKMYFTVTGLFRLPTADFIKPGMEVTLEKEPDNEYDSEAITVSMEAIGKIGYVANSVHTVIGTCASAGRIYDKFDKAAKGKVLYNMDEALVCELMI